MIHERSAQSFSGCLALIEGRVTPDVVTAFVAASTHSDDSGGASSSGGAGRLSVSGSIEDFKNNFQGTSLRASDAQHD
jgi:hypothetical protein